MKRRILTLCAAGTTSLATISLESMEFRNLSSTELASEDFGVMKKVKFTVVTHAYFFALNRLFDLLSCRT